MEHLLLLDGQIARHRQGAVRGPMIHVPAQVMQHRAVPIGLSHRAIVVVSTVRAMLRAGKRGLMGHILVATVAVVPHRDLRDLALLNRTDSHPRRLVGSMASAGGRVRLVVVVAASHDLCIDSHPRTVEWDSRIVPWIVSVCLCWCA